MVPVYCSTSLPQMPHASTWRIALSSSIPEEGGLYVWTSRAFGPRQGFLSGFLSGAGGASYSLRSQRLSTR